MLKDVAVYGRVCVHVVCLFRLVVGCYGTSYRQIQRFNRVREFHSFKYSPNIVVLLFETTSCFEMYLKLAYTKEKVPTSNIFRNKIR